VSINKHLLEKKIRLFICIPSVAAFLLQRQS
jgi:hypothetical protein